MRQQVNFLNDNSNVKPRKIINVSEEQEIQIFAKQMLSKRFFVGHYQERRYVQPLNSYRDIIRVSNTDRDLVKDLLIVMKRVLQFFLPPVTWTGITGPDLPGAPSGVSLWVKLKNLPFGHYLFQIREVQFLENEILLRLKSIRACTADCGSLTAPLSSESKGLPSNESAGEFDSKNVSGFNIQDALNIFKNIKYSELGAWFCSSFKEFFTIHSVREVGKFSIILLLSAIACVFKFVIYVGDFSLKLIHEISILIYACTPIFLGIIDFFTKCVGGFYILIAMIWRGSPPNIPSQSQQRHLSLQNYPYNQPAPYIRRSK